MMLEGTAELGKRGPQIFDSDAEMAKQLQKLIKENNLLKNLLTESQEEVSSYELDLIHCGKPEKSLNNFADRILQVEMLKQKIDCGHDNKKMKSEDDLKSQSRCQTNRYFILEAHGLKSLNILFSQILDRRRTPQVFRCTSSNRP
jgi:hypothetical protein